jgi:uncharacterized membrane protein YdjX (TVP38/TMEM64 family)
MMKNKLLSWVNENKFLVFALALIASFLIFLYLSNGSFYDMLNNTDSIINFVNSFGSLAIVSFTILVIVEVVVAPIPSVILYAAGGILFGTFLGGTAALIGNIIGAIIAFEIARNFLRKPFEKKIEKSKLKKFDQFSKKYGGYAMFILRINPFTSSDVFSYLAGLTKIKRWHLILGTALGLAPLTYIQAYLGDGFVKNNSLLSLFFIFVAVAYIIVFFYFVFKKTERRNK